MGKVVKRVIWFCAIGSMIYTSISCYLLSGWFAANCGIKLPLWGELMSAFAKVLVWCAGR